MVKRRNASDAPGPSGPLSPDPLIPPIVSFQQGLEDPSDQQELVIPALSVQPPSSSPHHSARQAKSKGKGPIVSARPEGINIDESDREESPDLPSAQSP
ncbi:hypothetical protein FRC03_002843 [Tulasnella sp. 419]|nr:hypothetical protein FRC03_002843 [Tulasnella sp. 419]